MLACVALQTLPNNPVLERARQCKNVCELEPVNFSVFVPA